MTGRAPHPLDALEATALALLAQIRALKQPAATLTGAPDDEHEAERQPDPAHYKAFGRPRLGGGDAA